MGSFPGLSPRHVARKKNGRRIGDPTATGIPRLHPRPPPPPPRRARCCNGPAPTQGGARADDGAGPHAGGAAASSSTSSSATAARRRTSRGVAAEALAPQPGAGERAAGERPPSAGERAAGGAWQPRRRRRRNEVPEGPGVLPAARQVILLSVLPIFQ